jgi:hypothetical protein
MLPGQQVEDSARAYLVIIGDARTGVPPENVRLIPVTALRVNSLLYMPLIKR